MTAPALTITITSAGLAAFTAAQLAGAPPLAVTAVALTDTAFVVAPSLTALPGEARRLDTISGEVVDADTIHLIVRDDDPDASYGVRGFGLVLADGTLFAVYGQADRVFEKSTQSSLLAALDLTFPALAVDHITFGDANFLNPPATERVPGVIAIATLEAVEAGEETNTALTPKTFATRMAAIITYLVGRIAAVAAACIPLTQRGAPNGVATLDVNGEIPPQQLQNTLDRLIPNTRAISAGDGLIGGGTLAQDIAFSIDEASGSELIDGEAAHKVATAAALGSLAAAWRTDGEFALPGGPLVKVVTVMGPFPEGAVVVPFVHPFPVACVIAIPVGINASGSTLRDIYLQEQSIAADRFTAFVQKAGTDGTNIDGVRVLALGY